MDASYILPFIESIKSVFATMLQLPVRCDRPVAESAIPADGCDISGIIGMSGGVLGSVVLGFPMASARAVVSRFVGTDVAPETEDFGDAVGELLNMIAGGAKAKFKGRSVSISCPSVVVGSAHKVQRMSDAVCIRIPCRSECGTFAVDISIKEAPVIAADACSEAAATSTP